MGGHDLIDTRNSTPATNVLNLHGGRVANQATLNAGLGSVPCTREAGWRGQFACPTGWLGVLVGHLMALKNRERSGWVLSKLSLDEDDRVLEIGSGPGADIREAARRAGYVTGIDPSEVMVRQARRRNREAVEGGRVDVRLGAMPVLPFNDGAFDKAFAINSFQFWRDKDESSRALFRVVKPGGQVVIAVQPRHKGAKEEAARVVGREIAGALTSAGFSNVIVSFKKMRPVATACVTATR
jgi:SAM-dependent methyltransferase